MSEYQARIPRERPVSIGRVCHIHDLEAKVWGARGGAGMGNKFGGYIYAGDGSVCGGEQRAQCPGPHPASRILPGTDAPHDVIRAISVGSI